MPARLTPTRREALIACVAAATAPAVSIAGTTFYIDPNGDDARDGMSPSSAWRSLARVQLARPTTGNAVLLKRGGVWRETLSPGADHLHLGAYGRGPKPVVSGADPIIADRRIRTLADVSLWAGDVVREPTQVFEDGRRLLRVAKISQLRRPGSWCWNPEDGVIVATPRRGPSPGSLEASVRESALDLEHRAGLSVEGLALRHAARDCIGARTLDSASIIGCDILGGYVSGVQMGGEALRRSIVLRGNRIAECGGVGIGFGGRLDDWVIEENLVERCATLTERAVGDGRERSFAWTAGIKNWGWGGAGWQSAYVIRRNTVRDCGPTAAALVSGQGREYGHGIWCDEVLEPASRPAIYENSVSRCWSRGIYLEKTDDHDAIDNVVRDCAVAEGVGAIEVQSNRYGYDVARDRPDDHLPRRVAGNRVAHNTVEGGAWALSVYCLDKGCSLSDTRIERNHLVGTAGRGGAIAATGGGANNGRNGSGNTYMRNCVGLGSATLNWDGRSFDVIEAFESASGGAVEETHAVGADRSTPDRDERCGAR